MARLSTRQHDWPALLLSQVRGAIAGGVSVVQIRESDLEAGSYVSLVRACLEIAAGTPCKIIVSDRVDVALVAGAHGVHLRERSVPLTAARRLLHAQQVVGRSVHDAATAVTAREADYLIAGSVFKTESKPGADASLGLEGLRRVVDAAGTCPVWAIGGLTPERLPEVSTCGIKGVAAIGAFLPSGKTGDIEHEVEELTKALRFSIDNRG